MVSSEKSNLKRSGIETDTPYVRRAEGESSTGGVLLEAETAV